MIDGFGGHVLGCGDDHVRVRHPLQDSLLCLSAATAGVAAGRGEADKDSHHEASVRTGGGIFVPLVVESLGLWSLSSLAVLRNIALRISVRVVPLRPWPFVILLSNCPCVCGGTTHRCCFTTSTCCPAAHCGSWVVDPPSL